MKDLIESMAESGSSGDDKLAKVAADIKAVAKEMGLGADAVLEKLEGMCCEQDDDADISDDGAPEAPEMKDMGGKKALVIAMMKKKNGKM